MLVWATVERTVFGGHALQPGDEIRERTAPCLTSLALAALPPPPVEGCKEDEVPSAGILMPPCSFHPVRAIRKYDSAHALRTTTTYEQASAARAELVVDVSLGYFRAHDCWRARSPARTKESGTSALCFSLLVLGGHLRHG